MALGVGATPLVFVVIAIRQQELLNEKPIVEAIRAVRPVLHVPGPGPTVDCDLQKKITHGEYDFSIRGVVD
jgi:hypothetical protein